MGYGVASSGFIDYLAGFAEAERTSDPQRTANWIAVNPQWIGAMHYPRRVSKVKRRRKQGFRARMRTPGGRAIIRRKRRRGKHSVNVKNL